jgi:hypothetical protein
MSEHENENKETTGGLAFHEWLAAHSQGRLNDDATAALRELTYTVESLRKSGKMILEITVEPVGQAVTTVAIGGTVTVKPPKPAPEMSIFFVGENGTLHRNDPTQRRIPGFEIDLETGEVLRDLPSEEST